MKKILVIGSVVCDIHIYMDHLPEPEEDVNPYRQQMLLGGCAYNVAMAIRLFDVPYTLFSPVGTGIYGDFIRNGLKESQVPIMIEAEEENGCCYCLIDAIGNRSFLSLHGAEYRFRKEWLQEIDTDAFDMIYVCGLEIEETENACLIEFLQKNSDKYIVYAPGPRIAQIPAKRNEILFSLASLIHCNQKELVAYTGIEDVQRAIRCLYRDAVITNGADPVLIKENDSILEVPVLPVKQVNGTGAGDGHCGAVMAQLAMGHSLEEAVQVANRIGSAIVSSNASTLRKLPENM